MRLDSVNNIRGKTESGAARATGEARPRAGSIRPEAAQAGQREAAGDAATFENFGAAARALSDQQERIAAALESRRKLVDAIREVMHAGGYETPEAAERAAEGMLRRGTVA